ncbi:MAG: ABC transporter permease, partial [Acidobacteriota bacterium]|nr:ABC transporter permease [Acidobacteriota bacterium]
IAVMATGGVPFTGTWSPTLDADGMRKRTVASYASNRYFETLGIGLVRGRDFTVTEGTTGAPVAVVSEATARTLWPGEDPLGRKFALDMNFRGQMKTFDVIGVARDVRYSNLTRLDPSHVYVAGPGPGSSIVLRPAVDREQLARMLTGLPDSLVRNAKALNLDESFVAPLRRVSDAMAGVAAVLAGLAVAIAGIGIFGVVSYLVGLRTREIGVRMALGAGAQAVLRGVVGQALRPVFAGSAAGIVLAAGLSAVLHQTLIFPGSMDFFYGVPFYDPVTFGGIGALDTMLAMAASWVPARRALRVDPAVALRYE